MLLSIEEIPLTPPAITWTIQVIDPASFFSPPHSCRVPVLVVPHINPHYQDLASRPSTDTLVLSLDQVATTVARLSPPSFQLSHLPYVALVSFSS